MGRDGGALQWRSIAGILADEDLMGIADGNPDPIDEYRPEAEDIRKQMRRNPDGPMPQIVAGVFRHWFEVRISVKEAERIARRIEAALDHDATGA